MHMSKNVLIVDDFGPNLLVLESILEGMPIEILKASNGQDALKIILKEHVDMVLLDVQMPDLTGYEVGELIRNRKKTKQIPILFLSGLIDKNYFDFKEKYPENVECFQKPINIDEMKICITHYLNK